MRGIARSLALSAGLLSAGLPGPPAARAQDLHDLMDQCVASGNPQLECAELAVTARAIQGQVGFLSGLGSEVSGIASTLGRRLGSTPRVSVGARAAFMSVGLPDLADPNGAPSRKATFVVPVAHAGLAVGVFDGFSLAPTVGGFLSVDLLAQASATFLPEGEGFDGRASAFSFGARVGILRESFTLPGVSLSVSRRSVGTIRYGTVGGPGGAVEVDPSVTSIRATVGKDLIAVGLLAGAGWDRYSGSATLYPSGLQGPGAVTESFHHSRGMVFGGAALNFLVLQLSAEVGWVRGFAPARGYARRPFDPTKGSFYTSLAARLTI
ncbi:MAG: hypothetical protein P8170_06820 [Gemmatimonadota bacterium]